MNEKKSLKFFFIRPSLGSLSPILFISLCISLSMQLYKYKHQSFIKVTTKLTAFFSLFQQYICTKKTREQGKQGEDFKKTALKKIWSVHSYNNNSFIIYLVESSIRFHDISFDNLDDHTICITHFLFAVFSYF